ncbi:MAG: hypothetical protein LBK18_01050 [Prevotellaceae bacterium]|jgi:hypothetical protein|nr:hypothetical protein [Prevotellaceae bacterium]
MPLLIYSTFGGHSGRREAQVGLKNPEGWTKKDAPKDRKTTEKRPKNA